MKVQKLSLAELKAKAANTNQNEVLEKVQGGKWNDCHGISGGLGKFFRDVGPIRFDLNDGWG